MTLKKTDIHSINVTIFYLLKIRLLYRVATIIFSATNYISRSPYCIYIRILYDEMKRFRATFLKHMTLIVVYI